MQMLHCCADIYDDSIKNLSLGLDVFIYIYIKTLNDPVKNTNNKARFKVYELGCFLIGYFVKAIYIVFLITKLDEKKGTTVSFECRLPVEKNLDHLS